jgi:ABC-type transport system substrate-binding protein
MGRGSSQPPGLRRGEAYSHEYLEQVGDEGFKRYPIGAGPYRFISHTPGIDLVVEANEATGARYPG